MKALITSFLLAFFFVAHSSAEIPANITDCDHLSGTWKASAGTTLTVNGVDPVAGKINIEFKSSPSLFPDGPFYGTGLIGKIPESTDPSGASDDSSSKALPIAFVLKWPEGSVSAFTGYCRNVNGVPTIKTLWHESQPVAKLPIYHILSNSIVFRSTNYQVENKEQL